MWLSTVFLSQNSFVFWEVAKDMHQCPWEAIPQIWRLNKRMWLAQSAGGQECMVKGSADIYSEGLEGKTVPCLSSASGDSQPPQLPLSSWVHHARPFCLNFPFFWALIRISMVPTFPLLSLKQARIFLLHTSKLSQPVFINERFNCFSRISFPDTKVCHSFHRNRVNKMKTLWI